MTKRSLAFFAWFLFGLVPALADGNGGAFPDLSNYALKTQIPSTSSFVPAGGDIGASGAANTISGVTGQSGTPTLVTVFNAQQAAISAATTTANGACQTSGCTMTGAFVGTTVATSGGVTTGTSTTSTSVANTLNSAVGFNRNLTWQTAGKARWIAFADATAESGSNVGSMWRLRSYDDTGALLGDAMACTRPTFACTITNLTANALTSTGAFQQASQFNVAAAGTTLATATALSKDLNVVNASTSGSATGVLLRAWASVAQQSNAQEVINATANTISVYPPVATAQIWVLNGSTAALAAGAAATLGTGTHGRFWCTSATLCFEAP